MSAVTEWVSIREFARRDGCNEKLVREKIAQKILQKINGKLDASLVGTGWRESNRRNSKKVSAPADPPPSAVSAVSAPACFEDIEPELAAAADRFIAANGLPMRGRAESEEVKANYDALLRQLEYDTKKRPGRARVGRDSRGRR